LPFEDDTMKGLFQKIERGKFEFPDWIKGDAKDLIQKMLRTDPNKRITIAEIMKHPWFTVYEFFIFC
jgi:serine/threonine protein kinase